jgi:hypothetical protein
VGEGLLFLPFFPPAARYSDVMVRRSLTSLVSGICWPLHTGQTHLEDRMRELSSHLWRLRAGREKRLDLQA